MKYIYRFAPSSLATRAMANSGTAKFTKRVFNNKIEKY